MAHVLCAARPVDDARITWIPPGLAVRPPQTDDTVMLCADCGGECWVGPAKKVTIDRGMARLVCYPCLRVHYEQHGPPKTVNVDPTRRDKPRR